MRDTILANQETESSVNPWLQAHAMLDVTGFPLFVGALDVISSVLSMRLLLAIFLPYFDCKN